MKHKKSDKRLFLNKETISHLNRIEMKAIFGGETDPIVTSTVTMHSLCSCLDVSCECGGGGGTTTSNRPTLPPE